MGRTGGNTDEFRGTRPVRRAAQRRWHAARALMVSPLRDGWGYDFATGKPVDMRKPEELVRQNYERTLHEDYGYARGQMDIEVDIQRGERNKRRNPRDYADVVIYDTTDPTQHEQFSNIVGIVENKRPNRTEGLRQLMTYMTASSARWGIWTNGDDIEYVYRDPVSGEPRTAYIFDIPRAGEAVEDMGRLSKPGSTEGERASGCG